VCIDAAPEVDIVDPANTTQVHATLLSLGCVLTRTAGLQSLEVGCEKEYPWTRWTADAKADQ
jgi:hypothetical protein